MKSDFADDNDRSQAYARVRQAIGQLARLPPDPRNWRPNLVLLPQGSPEPARLLEYALLLGSRHGIVSRVTFVPGRPEEAMAKRDAELARLLKATPEGAVELLEEVIVAPDPEAVLPVFLQAHAMGPLKPNLAVLGYPGGTTPKAAFAARLRALASLRISCAVLLGLAGRRPQNTEAGRIDIWWRGYTNGSLMLILAHLLTLNPAWHRVHIRILRIAKTEAEERGASAELERLIRVSRIAAETKVFVTADPFSATLRRESRDALALFLGFVLPPEDSAAVTLFESTARVLDGMPPAFLISTSGAADLLA